jgi:hypothetical protein
MIKSSKLLGVDLRLFTHGFIASLTMSTMMRCIPWLVGPGRRS